MKIFHSLLLVGCLAFGLSAQAQSDLASLQEATFPSQEYIDAFNREGEIIGAEGTFDENGLRILAMVLSVDRAAQLMKVAMTIDVTPEFTAEQITALVEETEAEHFFTACDLLDSMNLEFSDVKALTADFVVKDSASAVIYQAAQTCTVQDLEEMMW